MPESGKTNYAFSHLLTQTAAYKALLGTNRRLLHGAIADVLLEHLDRGAPDELQQLQQVVEHLTASRRWAEAHRWCCVLLLRRVVVGWTDNWEALADQADQLWQQLREKNPGLPARSSHLHNAWALYLALTGQTDQALAESERALVLAREDGDQPQEAAALVQSGVALHHCGAQTSALDHFRQALDLYRHLGDTYGQLRCLNNIGLVLHESGRSEEALPYFETGLVLAQDGAYEIIRSNLGVNRGVALHALGQFAAAQECFEDALTAAEHLGDRSTMGLALANLGELAGRRGEWDLARQSLARALELAREIDAPRFIAWWIFQRSQVELQAGEIERAWQFSLEAQAAAVSSNDKMVISNVMLDAARLSLERQDQTTAARLLEVAEAAAAEIGYSAFERFREVVSSLRQSIAEGSQSSS